MILQVTSTWAHMKRAQPKKNWGSHVDLISQTISGNAAILSETSEKIWEKISYRYEVPSGKTKIAMEYHHFQ